MTNLFHYSDLYILVPSTIFLFCLFQKYFNILKYDIKWILHKHPWIRDVLNLFLRLSFICLISYLFGCEVYVTTLEWYGDSDLPKP